MEFKESVNLLCKSIKNTIKDIDAFELKYYPDPRDTHEFMDRAVRFIDEASKPLYEKIYRTTNIVEDNIRSVYILMDDATLEGHASELETHLAQLRVIGDTIVSAPTSLNDEVTDLVVKYADLQYRFLKISQIRKTDPELTAGFETTVMSRGGYRIVVDAFRNFKESCIKLLSILAITLGRWENKVEGRVDAESFEGAMFMTNYDTPGELSSKKGRKHDVLYL